ncbi:MAG: MFS transporter [Acidimicrobiales bacterium]|nr:MFS transporter [Acidimicrobiales bacterium]
MKSDFEVNRLPSKVLVFSVTAVGLLHNSIFVSSTPEILRSLGESENLAGLLIAAGSVPGIVVAPLIGFLADRFGRKKVLIPCLVIYGVFGLLVGLSPSLFWFLLIRIFQGLGSAGLINLVVVIISDNWVSLDRARLIGQNAAAITISVAVYPVLGGAITDLIGWRWTFLAFLAPLVVAYFVSKNLEDHQPGIDGSVRGQISGALSEVVKPAIATNLVIVMILFMAIFGLFQSLLPVHLEREFGLLPTGRGLVAAAPAIVAASSALAVARVRKRVQGGIIIYASLLIWGIAFLMMGFGSLPVLVLATMIYGLSEGLMIPTLQDLVAENAPEQLRGALLAMWTGAARLGQTVGPVSVSLALMGLSTSTVLISAGIAMLVISGLASITRTLIVSSEGPQTGRFNG